MALPFRQRIFLILVALTAVPTTLAVVGWALAVRTVAPSVGARVALEEMAASARRARRLDANDPATHAVAGGSADARGSGIRSAAPGAARARDGTRSRARARARGGAAARVPRGGASGRARDQESPHGHADRGRPARTDPKGRPDGRGRTGGRSDRDGGGRAGGGDAA